MQRMGKVHLFIGIKKYTYVILGINTSRVLRKLLSKLSAQVKSLATGCQVHQCGWNNSLKISDPDLVLLRHCKKTGLQSRVNSPGLLGCNIWRHWRCYRSVPLIAPGLVKAVGENQVLKSLTNCWEQHVLAESEAELLGSLLSAPSTLLWPRLPCRHHQHSPSSPCKPCWASRLPKEQGELRLLPLLPGSSVVLLVAFSTADGNLQVRQVSFWQL